MNISVTIETDAARKRELQQHLTALLPEWFAQAGANLHYARQAEVLTGYVARIGGEAKGLLLLKPHGTVSAEIYWMGVDPSCHRAGIGRALVEAAREAVRVNGAKYLFVATLHPRESYEPYQRTRRFYQAMGFGRVLEAQRHTDDDLGDDRGDDRDDDRDRNPLAYYMLAIA